MASPLVVMVTISVATPRSFSMPAMVWACHMARALPRVPRRHTPAAGPLLDVSAKSFLPSEVVQQRQVTVARGAVCHDRVTFC